MPAYCSVIQYVPDVVRGERINVGVVVFGDGRTRVRMLADWSRVRAFATADVVDGLLAAGRDIEGMGEAEIRAAARSPTSSVQLTKPAGSLLDADVLLEQSAPRFLVECPVPADNR